MNNDDRVKLCMRTNPRYTAANTAVLSKCNFDAVLDVEICNYACSLFLLCVMGIHWGMMVSGSGSVRQSHLNVNPFSRISQQDFYDKKVMIMCYDITEAK